MGVVGCAKKKDDFSKPNELIVCLSVTEDYDRTVGKKEAMKSYLSETLNMPVKLVSVTNGTAAIEAVKAEKAHIGSVGAFSYIVAKSKVDIVPLVTTASVSDTIEHDYKSTLIVPKNSKINSIDDIIKNKGELSMAWSYPTSTSGHLIPRNYLQSVGVLPEDFNEVLVAENHVSAVYSCITEKVDLAAVSDLTLKEYNRRGKITKDQYKVIWESEPIRRGAIFVNNKVNEALKHKIQKALLDLHVTSSETAKKIHYHYDYDVKYVATTDADYDDLRTMAKNFGLIE